jgi:hypothetical protein
VNTEDLPFPADVALLEKRPPALVTRSQSGVSGFKIADARPGIGIVHISAGRSGLQFRAEIREAAISC